MLNHAFGLQACLSTGLGVMLLFFPDDLRDYFCEATVRKCEKLSGCGLAGSLAGVIGCTLLAQAFLAYMAKGLKDSGARTAIAKVIAAQHAGVCMFIAKDVSTHLYLNSVW
eukprot:CAMPEP_0179437590 /NCGR_PEP_ID=MMETSP0799-20121207/21460_1 /TAXON_ID=46947 /ORGANISM="Geminigera cryophila, Strain CCMP2564" /LENGTH=110 /DNA_ID=CAMNT_0021218633 /DNA_START=192 /DNA_END=521 /DNA_ORIENTATION=-